jgi:very-short-patch-repair endonuclease
MPRHTTDPYRPHLVPFARRLRREATWPERLLWARLRRRALGVVFRRQRPVGPFVVDFLCPEARLVVEVDGRSHDGREVADCARQAILEARGLLVLRVTNDEVLRDPSGVARRIGDAVAARLRELGGA